MSRKALLPIALAAPIGAVTQGCTVYSELEGLARPEGGALADGRTPTPDGTASDGSTPPDRIGGDTGMGADATAMDAARDAGADVPVPPIDATRSDAGSDTSGGVDVTVDVAMPPPDSSPDASIDRADTSIDTTVPPAPDAAPDLRAPDVVDAGGRADADAAPPPLDADSGTSIDVREAGPTCWGGTPSTHDEDNDGIVDECDNCPSISNANQADVREVNAGGIADGVGDACDPRPTAGGDALFLFDGLNFTSFPADWTNIGAAGTWTASGSSVTATTTETGQELARNFPSSLNNYLAETAFTFTALETNGSSSLPFRRNGAGDGWRCVVGTPDAIQGQFFISKVIGGTSETTPPQITPISVPRPGNRYRVSGGAYDNNIYCMLGTGERQTRSDTSTSGESGFRSTSTTATFEYLLVYRLGGTL